MTLKPLANTYTFNVSTKNGIDMSSTYPKIYPRRQKDDVPEPPPQEDIIDESSKDDVTIAADAENPFDFRHFLSSGKDGGKQGDESEYNHGTSSPDYRTGTGSAMNTPQFTARKPGPSVTASKAKAATAAAQKAAPKPKKRKSPEPEPKPKKASASLPKKPPPTVRLERRAITDPKPKSAPAKPAKPTKKGAAAAAAAQASSKIKSAEIVHSSDDESDMEDDSAPAPAHREPSPADSPPPLASQRSPSPPTQSQDHHQIHTYDSDADGSDEDSDMEDSHMTLSGGGLEIEFEDPDAAPRQSSTTTKARRHPAGRLGYLNSPANGPMSLASVASSVEGTPRGNRMRNAHADDDETDDGVIDFDSMGATDGTRRPYSDDEDDAEGEVDVDVEPIDIGPPAQTARADADEQEEEGDQMEDLLFKEVLQGLAEPDEVEHDPSESEESEEE